MALDRRFTSALSGGVGRAVASEMEIVGSPRIRPAGGSVRAVICIRGAANRADQSYEDVRRIAEYGYPTIAGDFGWTTDSAGTLWGNSTARARLTSCWNYLISEQGAKSDKVLLAAYSGGMIAALQYAKWNPGKVAAIAASIPAVNLSDLHDNPGYAWLPQSIRDAYGGTLSSWESAKAANDPYLNLSAFAAIPMKLWYSSDDSVARPQWVTGLRDAHPTTVTIVNTGANGHSTGSLADETEHAEFLRAYAA